MKHISIFLYPQFIRSHMRSFTIYVVATRYTKIHLIYYCNFSNPNDDDFKIDGALENYKDEQQST